MDTHTNQHATGVRLDGRIGPLTCGSVWLHSFAVTASLCPAPPPPMSFAPKRAAPAAGGNDRGALLASIQAGKGLRKVAKPVEKNEFAKPQAGPNGEPAPAAAEPPKPKGPMSMADEMAARLAKRRA